MSTAANEQAQPNPADQSQAPAPNASSEHKPLNITSIEEVSENDPDLIELREAQAAAQAEEAAKSAPAGETVNGNAAPAPAATQGQDQQRPATAGSAMIPKPRFDEVLTRATTAEQNAAYWRGVAEARGQQLPAGQGQQQTAQPTAEQRLAEISNGIDALAKKFDDGEITMADFKKQERELQRKEQAIREEASPKAPQQAAGDGGGDALYLETVTAQLERDHPWVAVFDQVATDADWGYLKSAAVENLTAKGIDPTAGTIGKYHLRREVARLADELGPALLTSRAQAKGIALPGQPSPQPGQQQQQKPPLSPQAQNRLGKLQQQGSAPPDLSSMQGTGQAGVPDSSIENMTDDEIAALPPAVRQKLLLSSAS